MRDNKYDRMSKAKVRKKQIDPRSTVDWIPEIAAWVNDPMADGLVSQFLLLEGVLVAEQFQRQFVVGYLKEWHELLAKTARRCCRISGCTDHGHRRTTRRRRDGGSPLGPKELRRGSHGVDRRLEVNGERWALDMSHCTQKRTETWPRCQKMKPKWKVDYENWVRAINENQKNVPFHWFNSLPTPNKFQTIGQTRYFASLLKGERWALAHTVVDGTLGRLSSMQRWSGDARRTVCDALKPVAWMVAMASRLAPDVSESAAKKATDATRRSRHIQHHGHLHMQ